MKKIAFAVLGAFAALMFVAAVPKSASACASCGCQGDKSSPSDCGCKSEGKQCNCKGEGKSCEQAKKEAGSEGGKATKADAKTATPKSFKAKPAVGTKAVCPVMGGEFTVTKDTQFSKYKGKYYAFCCPGCKPKFDQSPEKFVK